MTLHLGSRFENETVEVDGQDFDTCAFVDCTLVYRGGEQPRLSNNTFVSCGWRLEDAALRTIAYLVVLYASGGSSIVDRLIAMIHQTELPNAPEGPIQ